MEEFDHEPCHAKLKALKAKYRQRMTEAVRRLSLQMDAMERGTAIGYQTAWNAGYNQALYDIRNPDG